MPKHTSMTCVQEVRYAQSTSSLWLCSSQKHVSVDL